MMNIVQDSIKKLYAGTEEQRSVEFKRGLVWEYPSPKSLELIKVVISMFNTPSGGDIILGISQKRNDSKLLYTGLKTDEKKSLIKNEEIIKDTINGYTTIKINPTFTLIEDTHFESQKDFLVIKVPHYEEYPCLVRKDGKYKINKKDGTLKENFKFYKSDLLTRSMYPKFSSRKVEQEELNEMIELCAKGVRTRSRNILNIKAEEKVKTNTHKKMLDKFKEERSKIYGNLPA